MSKRLLILCILIGGSLGAVGPASAQAAAPSGDGPIRVESLDLGPTWYGPPIYDKTQLVGKVVLFMLWGTCSCCKQVTPDMIKLARRLENRPFHLIAAHSQRTNPVLVTSYLRGLGLPPTTPNFTVTDFGSHPQVPGSGFVPYYMVFDYHGNLVYHHTAGGHHGGDGMQMIRWVDRLLAVTPAIYLGEKPYQVIPDLAEAVAARKNLARTLLEIQKRLDDEENHAAARPELERLLATVRAFRDAELVRVERDLASDPERVRPRLIELQRDLEGTTLGGMVSHRLQTLEDTGELKDALHVNKAFDQIVRRLEKRRACKECRRMGQRRVQSDCPACRQANKKAFEKAEKALQALRDRYPDCPVTPRVTAYQKAFPPADPE